jgi:hypothetical protein
VTDHEGGTGRGEADGEEIKDEALEAAAQRELAAKREKESTTARSPEVANKAEERYQQ